MDLMALVNDIKSFPGITRKKTISEVINFFPKFSMAKVLASDTALRVAIQAVEIFAGHGCMKDGPVEKCVRDSITFLHSDGANPVLRLRIASLIGGPAPKPAQPPAR